MSRLIGQSLPGIDGVSPCITSPLYMCEMEMVPPSLPQPLQRIMKSFLYISNFNGGIEDARCFQDCVYCLLKVPGIPRISCLYSVVSQKGGDIGLICKVFEGTHHSHFYCYHKIKTHHLNHHIKQEFSHYHHSQYHHNHYH